MEKTYKLFHIEAALSFANFTLLNGAFLIGIGLLFGADAFQLGLLAAIPLFSNVFQIISSYVIERTGNRKTVAIHSLTSARLAWVFIVLIGFGLLQSENKITWLIIVVLLSSILTSIGNLSLISWIARIVPQEGLAKFFGKRNTYAALAGIIAYFIGAIALNYYNNEFTYAILFSAAIIVGLLSYPVLSRIEFSREPKSRKKFFNYLKEIYIPFKDERFKPFLRFIAAWNLVINLASPFFIVYLLDDLKLSFLFVAMFIIIDSLARIYGMKIWGNIGDSYGAKGILIFGATISAIIPAGFLFINRSNYYLLFLIAIISAFSYAAVDIALAQLLFKLSPRKNDSLYITSFYGLIGVFAALGPIIGGGIAVIAPNHIPLFGFPALFIVFLLSTISRISVLPMIHNIEEREARDVKDVLENVKNIRFVSFAANFYSISNLISRVVLAPQEQLRVIQEKTFMQLKRHMIKSLELSRKAAYSIGKTANPATLRKIATDMHKIFVKFELPKKYSEYKALREMDNVIKEAAIEAESGKMTKKEAERIQEVMRKDRNILDKFLKNIIFRGKRMDDKK